MLRLDTTTRKLEVVLGGAITTNQLPVTASWSDASTGAYLGGCTVINTNSGTAVTAVAAPAAGTVRDIDFVNVYNADTVNAVVTVRYNDNATLYTEVKTTLTTGDTLRYTHADGWKVVDSNGSTKFSINNVTGNLTVGGTLTVTGATTLQSTLSLGGNVTLGANYISYGGTNAGLSLDASNNATFSGKISTISGDAAGFSQQPTTTTQGGFVQFVNSGGTLYVGLDNSTGSLFGLGNYASNIYRPAATAFIISRAGTADLTIGATGNITLSGTLTVSGTGTSSIAGLFDISGASAGQIKFPSTQNASSNANTLDDYAEGTWTPNQGAGLTVVGAFSSTGDYTKIGREVTVTGKVNGATSIAVSAAGAICSNLPFTQSGTYPMGSATNATLTVSDAVQVEGTTVYACSAISASGSIYFSCTYFI